MIQFLCFFFFVPPQRAAGRGENHRFRSIARRLPPSLRLSISAGFISVFSTLQRRSLRCCQLHRSLSIAITTSLGKSPFLVAAPSISPSLSPLPSHLLAVVHLYTFHFRSASSSFSIFIVSRFSPDPLSPSPNLQVPLSITSSLVHLHCITDVSIPLLSSFLSFSCYFPALHMLVKYLAFFAPSWILSSTTILSPISFRRLQFAIRLSLSILVLWGS